MAKSNERNIRSTAAMKAASSPAPRVDPVLCEEAEGALHFVARGLASRAKARRSGGYVEAKDVLAALQSRLDAARKG
ncbi:YlcI/YnfO family protein [Xanthomonas translucens]|uniref:YlcI/YnfO family protein n=1 Tax=Xanthomonas campestris pv. translucens TaxID=343 RepID=UPI000A8AEB38